MTVQQISVQNFCFSLSLKYDIYDYPKLEHMIALTPIQEWKWSICNLLENLAENYFLSICSRHNNTYYILPCSNYSYIFCWTIYFEALGSAAYGKLL